MARLVGIGLLGVVWALVGCVEAPVEPTDGGCGPGAWTSKTLPDGSVDPCVPVNW
jgi:hypothetical protein